MTKGIVLLAVKNPVYGKYAFNFAATLRKHTTIPIQLIHDREGISELNSNHYKMFDILTEVGHSFSHVSEKGRFKFVPAKAKLGIHKFAAFDENVFLDVDAVCIGKIDHLFMVEKEFATQVFDYCDSTAITFTNMLWAKPQKVWEHFKLNKDAKLPATNSSYMYWKRGIKANEVFDTALDELLNNTLPISEQWMKWGKSSPDELYLNVALAKLNYNAEFTTPYCLYFSNKRINSASDITAPIIGLYGQRGAIHQTIVDYAERVVRVTVNELGFDHYFKLPNMVREKVQYKQY